MSQPQKRTIRSFVRRTGRLTDAQRKALQSEWPNYGLEHGETPFDFDTIFARKAPRVLEIGFGNGETLVQQASDDPTRDYIGIEVHEPGVGHCLLKARQEGINNLRVIVHDAVEVLQRQIPVASLTRINLYFPDPWPKKRHHKRRIVQESFINLIAPRLVDGGRLYIATDWADYAEQIDAVVTGSNRFECATRRVHDGDRPLQRPRTKFEMRGLRKGHKICDWCFTKIA